jgi:hypothetical protein
MRMECRARNWGRAVVVEEARVWLKGREESPVDVEGLDLVTVRATLDQVSICFGGKK